MKQKETSLNIQSEEIEDHLGGSAETPLRPDAFEKDDDLKVTGHVPLSMDVITLKCRTKQHRTYAKSRVIGCLQCR